MLRLLAAALAAPSVLAHVRRLSDASGPGALVVNLEFLKMDTVPDPVVVQPGEEFDADVDLIGDLCFQPDPSNDSLLRFCQASDAGPLEDPNVRILLELTPRTYVCGLARLTT